MNSDTTSVPLKLRELAEQVHAGTERIESVRTLLSWFRAGRRGRLVLYEIQSALRKLDLVTKPNFRFASIDEAIAFQVAATTSPDAKTEQEQAVVPFTESLAPDGEPEPEQPATAIAEPSRLVSSVVDDPTYRIGRLLPDDAKLFSVTSGDSTNTAITHMLANEISQLPVLDGDRIVRGKISWRSIGSRLATGAPALFVRDCIEPCEVIRADTSLFSAIDMILRDECVLIKDRANLIIGIVTTHDLSEQFNKLSEPFLLLGEIENHIRRLMAEKFTESELRAACDPSDTTRVISDMSDLSLGECLRLIENPVYWGRLDVPVDRRVIAQYLAEVRDIRNNVMHFDPKGIADAELTRLRKTVSFFQKLINVLAI